MREFFKGWRRKAGCVALLMAVILNAGWIRNRVVGDCFWFTIGSRQHSILSLGDDLWWSSWSMAERDAPTTQWKLQPVNPNPEVFGRQIASIERDFRNLESTKERRFGGWRVHYWAIVVPMTILSALLILWKPRSKPKEQTNA